MWVYLFWNENAYFRSRYGRLARAKFMRSAWTPLDNIAIDGQTLFVNDFLIVRHIISCFLGVSPQPTTHHHRRQEEQWAKKFSLGNKYGVISPVIFSASLCWILPMTPAFGGHYPDHPRTNSLESFEYYHLLQHNTLNDDENFSVDVEWSQPRRGMHACGGESLFHWRMSNRDREKQYIQ